MSYLTEFQPALTVYWLVCDAQEDYTLKRILTYHVLIQCDIIIIDRIPENTG